MESESVTQLLSRARAGEDGAFDRAFGLVYEQLRQAARHQLRGRAGDTLSATALVNEAWLKLARGDFPTRDREHFIALAARAMRMIVVDHARQACAEKRGGQCVRVTLTASLAQEPAHGAEDLVALDAALQRLAALDERLARVVEWRYFGGMTEPEIGRVLGLTERTVRSDWRKARAFLTHEMALEARA